MKNTSYPNKIVWIFVHIVKCSIYQVGTIIGILPIQEEHVSSQIAQDSHLAMHKI